VVWPYPLLSRQGKDEHILQDFADVVARQVLAFKVTQPLTDRGKVEGLEFATRFINQNVGQEFTDVRAREDLVFRIYDQITQRQLLEGSEGASRFLNQNVGQEFVDARARQDPQFYVRDLLVQRQLVEGSENASRVDNQAIAQEFADAGGRAVFVSSVFEPLIQRAGANASEAAARPDNEVPAQEPASAFARVVLSAFITERLIQRARVDATEVASGGSLTPTPSAPTNVSASDASWCGADPVRRMRVTWQNGANFPPSGMTTQVWREVAGQTPTLRGTITNGAEEFLDDTLSVTSGAQVRYQVVHRDEDYLILESGFGSWVTVLIACPNRTFTSQAWALSCSGGVDTYARSLVWEAPPSGWRSQLQRRQNVNGTWGAWATVYDGTGSSYVDQAAAMQPGVQFGWRLRFVHEDPARGETSYTNASDATVPATYPCPALAPTVLESGDASSCSLDSLTPVYRGRVRLGAAAQAGITRIRVMRGTTQVADVAYTTGWVEFDLPSGAANQYHEVQVYGPNRDSGTPSPGTGFTVTPANPCPTINNPVLFTPTLGGACTAGVGTRSVHLSWLHGFTGTPPAGWRTEVWRGQGPDPISERIADNLPWNQESYQDSAVSIGASYRYLIRHTNGTLIRDSGASVLILVTQPCPVLAQPALTVTPSGLVHSLSWSGEPTGQGNVQEYRVYRRVGNGAWELMHTVAGGGSRSYTSPAMDPSTQYQWVVTAYNSAGSADSNLVAKPTRPAQPVLTATAMSSSQITLTWPAVLLASHYAIRRNDTMEERDLIAGSPYDWTGLPSGTTVEFVIWAWNEAGWSPGSTPKSATTHVVAPSAPTMGTPEDWSYYIHPNDVQRIWVPIPFNGTGDADYHTEVYAASQFNNGNPLNEVLIGTTSLGAGGIYHNGPLAVGELWYYRARHVSNVGKPAGAFSGWSAPGQRAINRVLAIPLLGGVDQTICLNNQIHYQKRIDWNAIPSGAEIQVWGQYEQVGNWHDPSDGTACPAITNQWTDGPAYVASSGTTLTTYRCISGLGGNNDYRARFRRYNPSAPGGYDLSDIAQHPIPTRSDNPCVLPQPSAPTVNDVWGYDSSACVGGSPQWQKTIAWGMIETGMALQIQGEYDTPDNWQHPISGSGWYETTSMHSSFTTDRGITTGSGSWNTYRARWRRLSDNQVSNWYTFLVYTESNPCGPA
jgi:hypothetical protein